MIGKLNGRVDSCFDDHAIIDVNGVGYLVYCSAKSLHSLVAGEFYQLFIETHVREDHIHLYGFLSIEEKSFFNILQSVSGIGPRLALLILSHLPPGKIQLAVNQRDKEVFRAISGVGPKLAERIIIELKDKVMPNLMHSNDTSLNLNSIGASEIAIDAISALTNLGVNKIEAQNSVIAILARNEKISIDELIKLALKTRGR
jgi:Holliday junction DNA helicase RuvA